MDDASSCIGYVQLLVHTLRSINYYRWGGPVGYIGPGVERRGLLHFSMRELKLHRSRQTTYRTVLDRISSTALSGHTHTTLREGLEGPRPTCTFQGDVV